MQHNQLSTDLRGGRKALKIIGRVLFGLFFVAVMAVAALAVYMEFSQDRPTGKAPKTHPCERLDVPPRHQLINAARRSAKFPDTFSRHSSGRTVMNRGRYKVWVQFSAKNAFGVPSRHIASAWVQAQTCKLDWATMRVVGTNN